MAKTKTGSKIECYLHNGIFEEKSIDGFESMVKQLEEARVRLWQIPVNAVIVLLDALGREILLDKKLSKKEGMPFLAMWLRKNNLEEMVKLNIGNPELLDGATKLKQGRYLRAQPRGIVCHWIAGNIPTLAAFSLFQSVLCKNANIVRTPKKSVESFIAILRKLEDIDVEYDGQKYSGKDILKTISVVYYPSSEYAINQEFSMIADCKVAWGGKEAVDAIRMLPQKEHCETIIFGPKYSFGVIDKETVESSEKELDSVLESFCNEIMLFDQAACSSPHVLFFEKSNKTIRDIAQKMAEHFRKLSKRYPKQGMSQSTAANIINKRAEYQLDERKGIISSKKNDWTILIDDELRLEEPIQSRTIFVKEVESLMDVIPLITKKVQTIGMAIRSKKKMLAFAEKSSYHGVARLVIPSSMSFYESPWDGMMVLNRMVRLCSYYQGKEVGKDE